MQFLSLTNTISNAISFGFIREYKSQASVSNKGQWLFNKYKYNQVHQLKSNWFPKEVSNWCCIDEVHTQPATVH